MPGANDANGVYNYAEDDNISLFSDLLNLGTESISTQFTADRTRLTTLEAKRQGLVPISPSSVVYATGSGSVSSNGTVTFTGCTSVSLNNVFSSSYKNYKVLVNITSWVGTNADTFLYVRMRNAGTDSTTSYHTSHQISVVGGAPAGTGAYNTSVFFSGRLYYSTSGMVADMTLFNPFASASTRQAGIGAGSTAGAPGPTWFGGEHAVTSSQDGMTILPSGGTFSGTITCYGIVD